MAFLHGKSTVVVYGSTDLSSYLNEVTAPITVDLAETTTLGKNDKTYIAGLADGTVSLSGMFDGSAGAIEPIVRAQLQAATGTVVTVGLGGTTVGSACRMLSARNTSMEISSPVGDVVALNTEIQADGGIDIGKILHAMSSVTAGASDTSVDNAAASSNGGVAHLNVTVNTHDGDLVAKVQHSTDNSTWVDLVTFTTVATTVTTSERVEVAAGTTVNRYLRCTYTMSGGSGAVTFVVAFARR